MVSVGRGKWSQAKRHTNGLMDSRCCFLSELKSNLERSTGWNGEMSPGIGIHPKDPGHPHSLPHTLAWMCSCYLKHLKGFPSLRIKMKTLPKVVRALCGCLAPLWLQPSPPQALMDTPCVHHLDSIMGFHTGCRLPQVLFSHAPSPPHHTSWPTPPHPSPPWEVASLR